MSAVLAETHSRSSDWQVRESGPDAWLIALSLGLLLFGLTMVLSASVAKESGQPFYYFTRQCVSAVIGITLAGIALRTPLAQVQRLSTVLMWFAFILAASVLLFGKKVNGSTRWFVLGKITLQASEPIKLFVVMYLAGYLVRRGQQVRESLLGFINPIVLVTALAALLLLEPDLGAAAVVFATTLGMLLIGGVPTLRFLAWTMVALASLATLMVVEWYRMVRLFTFMDPWADPRDSGYQLVNSLMAFGRGGWSGVGLGGSVQKMLFLPEVHTDFIFAVVGEELGMLGSCAVIAAFTLLVWRIFSIAADAARRGHLYGAYVAYGTGLIIGLQAFINMGVNLGLLPTKGLTLPLISYGNNSLVIILTGLGMVARVSYESRLLSLRPFQRRRA